MGIHFPSLASAGSVMMLLLLLSWPGQAAAQPAASPGQTTAQPASTSSYKSTGTSIPLSAAVDSLMDAPIPIVYGETGFRQRLESRTGGTREALGLVLSGGSARAFAHIGVLARLEEANIVPDFIVANSMGSIIGLLYAAGLSPDQIRRIVTETEIAPLFSPVFPLKGGLLDVSRFSALVRSYLGELRLEDLPIPILVCTEDLVSKREIRIAEGDFYTVMEAAYALPVYFPPVPYGQHLLIDGGITNLVPLGVAYDYTDTVIVSSTFYDAKGLNLRNPLIILNTAIDIGKRRAGVADLAAHPEAIWIRCDVESFSFMAFDSISVLVEAGYRSADAMADTFRGLPASGLDPVLLAMRGMLEERIPEAMLSWNRFERASVDKTRIDLALGIASYAYPGDRWFLRDSIMAETALGLRTGDLEASIGLGLDWEAYGQASGAHQPVAPAASLAVSFYPAPALGLFSYGALRWEGEEDGFSGYARNGLQAAFPGVSGRVRVDLRSYLEHRLDADFRLESMLLTSSGELSLAAPRERMFLSFEAGHQLAGDYDQHLGFATASAGLDLVEQLSLTVSGLVRAGLSAGSKAPLFLSDNFGALDPSRYSGLSRVLALGSLVLQWSPEGFRPSFGELLLLKNNSLSLFSDFMVRPGYSNGIPVVAGLRLKSEISLIGLESSTVQAELGYDTDAGAYVFRVFLF